MNVASLSTVRHAALPSVPWASVMVVLFADGISSIDADVRVCRAVECRLQHSGWPSSPMVVYGGIDEGEIIAAVYWHVYRHAGRRRRKEGRGERESRVGGFVNNEYAAGWRGVRMR